MPPVETWLIRIEGSAGVVEEHEHTCLVLFSKA
jgi:hypothetical protein